MGFCFAKISQKPTGVSFLGGFTNSSWKSKLLWGFNFPGRVSWCSIGEGSIFGLVAKPRGFTLGDSLLVHFILGFPNPLRFLFYRSHETPGVSIFGDSQNSLSRFHFGLCETPRDIYFWEVSLWAFHKTQGFHFLGLTKPPGVLFWNFRGSQPSECVTANPQETHGVLGHTDMLFVTRFCPKSIT